MIRARHAIRPDMACHSADVLTGPERVADRVPRDFAQPAALVYRDGGKTWADDPEIRTILQTLRGKL